jgi:tetratricopeptide (TPR) repeat protein
MRLRAILLAASLAPSGAALAQNKPNLPQELRGTDPKPDTQQAADYLKRGRYEDAIRQAKLALGRDEKYSPAMVVLAKAYYYEHKFELSTAIIDIAKSIDPNCAECYNLLGFISLDHQPPDRISATAAFKKATELKGDYGAAWNNLAAQYLFAKNYDGALEAAQHAAQLQANYAAAHLNLGSALRGKQQYAEAEKEYKKAIDLDSSLSDAFFNLGILYLDAKDMPGTDLISRLNTSIQYLNKYKQVAGSRLTREDPADGYITDARTQIDKENKKQERMRKQQERDRAKAAANPAPAAPAAGAKTEGK